MKKVELSSGGIFALADHLQPIALSRTGSTEVYFVSGKFLEVQYLKSGRVVGEICESLPNWVRPVNQEWAKARYPGAPIAWDSDN